MASKRHQRQKSCVGKRRYVSQQEAWRVVGRSRAQGYGVEMYRCQFCGGWHVGHTRRLTERIERAYVPPRMAP